MPMSGEQPWGRDLNEGALPHKYLQGRLQVIAMTCADFGLTCTDFGLTCTDFGLTVLFVKTDVVYTLVVLFLIVLSAYGLIPD